MSTVQFEPKITTEFQIDWRRRPSQGADPFTDFLKQHFDVDQRPRAPKPREEAADPLSGRKPHVVVAHAKTLRGEAKRVEDADRCLTDRSGETETDARDEAPLPLEDDAAADGGAGATGQDAAITENETDAAPEQPVPAADNAAAPADPVAPVVVSVQSTDLVDADLVVTPLVEPAEEGVVPEPQGKTETPSNGAETEPDVTAEQQAVTAMAESGLAADVSALVTGEASPPDAAATVAAVAETPVLPAAPAKTEQPLLQVAEGPEIAPAPPRPERAPIEIKLRPSTLARPAAAQAAPTPAATPAAQPVQPHATAALPSAPAGEFASTGEPFDSALSDGGGQGWALHLAQGAASKRPDFVAQLRQHLQNLPAHEQVAIHLQRAAREGTNKFSIQLSPAELGNIHVKLEIDEEKRVTAAVTVERPSTLELLQRDIKGLERALHNAGLNMEGGDLSFSLGRGDQEFAQDLRQSGASAAGGPDLDGESDGDQPDTPVAQVMDTAAGVVNLQV